MLVQKFFQNIVLYISSRRMKKWSKFERAFQSINNRVVRQHCQNKCDQKQCEYFVAKCTEYDFEKKTHVLLKRAIIKIIISSIWITILFLNRSLTIYTINQKNSNRTERTIKFRRCRRRRVQESLLKNDILNLLQSIQSNVIFWLDQRDHFTYCLENLKKRRMRTWTNYTMRKAWIVQINPLQTEQFDLIVVAKIKKINAEKRFFRFVRSFQLWCKTHATMLNC